MSKFSKNSQDNRTRKLSFLGFNTTASGNADPDLVLLDTEMEKVFAGTNTSKDTFDVNTFSLNKDDRNRGKNSFSLSSNDEPGQQRKNPELGQHDGDDSAGKINKIDDGLQEESPLISERAGFGDHSDSSQEEKHVQFQKGKQEDFSPEVSDRFDERKRRRSRHQYYKHRKHSHQEVLEGGKTTELPIFGRQVSMQPEDSTLEESDLNELTSHRSDDPRALRRHKIHHTLGKYNELLQLNVPAVLRSKKIFDHSPHEVFVQLDELHGSGEDREWKETARWIKYEEHVEEGSDRWGRPHVASLSFHSLLNLRRCLETGVVLLDLEEKDLPGVAYRVVEQMVIEDLIRSDDKPTVMRALLLRHRHVNEHSHSSFPFGKKKCNSYTSLQNLSEDKRPKVLSANEINGNSKKGDTKIDMKDETYSSSQEDFKKLQNDTILRRIPHGAEATTVLVGAVDFLEQPTIAFVRLAESIPMPSITEVPIPVRFLFILLGPKIVDLDYHEVGRSIATLMSTEHFQKMAYKADDRKKLLSAINEFLDDSIVLPPGNWDRHDLLPFEELKAKKDWIRSRKKKALEEKNKLQKFQIDDGKKLIVTGAGMEKKAPKKSPLEKTYKMWGGLLNDIKRRFPMYKSDILDGLNTETLAATVFMYFAALSTAITFGGLASDKTHNLIGISETLLSASVVGLFFHTFSGQPLVIIGTTGPLLLFDEALFKFCADSELKFLTVRAYVGIWLVVIGLLVSAFEGSVYVRLLTRFTQEIFSALITLIYIVETFMKLISVYKRHPLLSRYDDVPEESFIEFVGDNNDTNITDYSDTVQPFDDTFKNVSTSLFTPVDDIGPFKQPNTALFCTILTLGTFTIAYYLKLFRNSHFLGRNARRALGDFGVPIAIAIFVLIDYLTPQVFTETLSVPTGLSPSDPKQRSWFIPLGPVPTWLPFAAVVPAILVYILIFMETHISELIVDKPERGLKKGSGLHLDIVLLCFLNVLCGFFGMPWHCAATVRSVAHVSAVTIMSRTHAPGETPRITEVKEQRLSGLFVSLMVGLSVTMAPLLRLIPMAVLFGVFLYMGVASMSGVQFFDRIRLFFMPVKHHPQMPYVKRVHTWKMHIFTAIQIILLSILWAVKSSKFSLAFPFFLIMMVPFRMKLTKFYTQQEMNALDGSQPKVEADDEPDFYEQATIPA